MGSKAIFSSLNQLIVMILTVGSGGWTTLQNPAPANPRFSELVAHATPGGWELYDEVLQFSPENLYEQINGRAELFLSYNVVALTFATFDKRDNSGSFIDLYVYEMDTTLNAFGVFSVERTVGDPDVRLSRIGYRSGASHYLWKGRYYVKAIASDNDKRAQEAALCLVQRISDHLTDKGGQVWGFKVFPPEGLVPDSLRYFLVDALGLDFMGNTFTAVYRLKGSDIPAFVSKRASDKEVISAFERYADFAGRYGKGVSRSTRLGSELLICEMKEGYDVVTKKGIYLIGVTAVPERTLALETVEMLQTQCCLE
jgi:hypothetical protein